MLTVSALNDFGANTAEGLGRCLNQEVFYLRLVNMALNDGGFEQLRQAVESGDKKEAFEAAHSLKGVLGNLALTPLYESVSEVTELLRAGKDADYAALLAGILAKREELLALRDA